MGSVSVLPALQRQGIDAVLPVEMQGTTDSVIWLARLFKRENCL